MLITSRAPGWGALGGRLEVDVLAPTSAPRVSARNVTPPRSPSSSSPSTPPFKLIGKKSRC